MAWFVPMLGKALLGGVASALASRVMQPKQTIEHRTTRYSGDLPAMVKDAQKAGINPLTALRSGMGGAYGRTIAPPLASPTFMQSALGGAISGFGNYIQNMPTPYETEMRGLRMKELKGNIGYTAALKKDLLSNVNNEAATDIPLMDKTGQPVKNKFGQQIMVPKEANEAIPLYVTVWDQKTGRYFAYPNPELIENSPSEMVASLAALGAADAASVVGVSDDYQTQKLTTDVLDALQKTITSRPLHAAKESAAQKSHPLWGGLPRKPRFGQGLTLGY